MHLVSSCYVIDLLI
uniref:Uncharacterized protein n=1 Tax=Rhizophora mucronata TaxID=61149 RepID=A0A2P2Q4I5_RHIMU